MYFVQNDEPFHKFDIQTRQNVQTEIKPSSWTSFLIRPAYIIVHPEFQKKQRSFPKSCFDLDFRQDIGISAKKINFRFAKYSNILYKMNLFINLTYKLGKRK